MAKAQKKAPPTAKGKGVQKAAEKKTTATSNSIDPAFLDQSDEEDVAEAIERRRLVDQALAICDEHDWAGEPEGKPEGLADLEAAMDPESEAGKGYALELLKRRDRKPMSSSKTATGKVENNAAEEFRTSTAPTDASGSARTFKETTITMTGPTASEKLDTRERLTFLDHHGVGQFRMLYEPGSVDAQKSFDLQSYFLDEMKGDLHARLVHEAYGTPFTAEELRALHLQSCGDIFPILLNSQGHVRQRQLTHQSATRAKDEKGKYVKATSKDLDTALTKDKLLLKARMCQSKAAAFTRQADEFEEAAKKLPASEIRELDLDNDDLGLATFTLPKKDPKVTWQELVKINREQQDTLIATSERIRQELVTFQAVVDRHARVALERESRLGFIIAHLQKMIADNHKLELPGWVWAELGRQSGKVHPCCCEACVRAGRGVARTRPVLTQTDPSVVANYTQKEELSLRYHTAVIDRPQGQALACRDSVPVAYDRNPSNTNWTAYGHRLQATKSWEGAMDPTLIPAGGKSQDDGSEPVREVRRPRMNKHDRGKVYLERIKTIGPGLLEDLKARELSLVNHKRQGPLQAFRARERAREAEEGDYFIPANPSQRPEPLLRELEVSLLGEDLIWLVYEAYGGKSVISGSTGPLVLVRWAEPTNDTTDTDVKGKVWSLVKLLELVPMTVSEADSHQVILLGQRAPISYGQTVLSEVQAKMDSFLGSEEDRRSNAAKMGQAESLLLYTPWALGKDAIASEGELAKAAEILGFRASNAKTEGNSHKRASEMVESLEQPEPKRIKSEDGESQTSVERTRYPSLDSVLREHYRNITPEPQDYQELVDHFRYGKTSALDDLPDEVRIPPRRSFHSQPPQHAYHPTEKDRWTLLEDRLQVSSMEGQEKKKEDKNAFETPDPPTFSPISDSYSRLS